jgi:hypothetical protein
MQVSQVSKEVFQGLFPVHKAGIPLRTGSGHIEIIPCVSRRRTQAAMPDALFPFSYPDGDKTLAYYHLQRFL